MIGYPRFDAWFSSKCDQNLIRKKYGLAVTTPTILYLPTWQHRSSIDTFADSVFALAGKFEVLVKPHHRTYRHEPSRMCKLESRLVKMLSPYTLPEEAFALADIVISDVSSGALTEGIFLNKRVVCLARPEELENLLMPEIRRQIPICLAPEELSQKVEEAVAMDIGSEGLQKLRRYMFDTSNGADGERAAQEIVRFIERSRYVYWSSVRTGLRWRKEYLRNCVGQVKRRILALVH
jgi:hypothetical protein